MPPDPPREQGPPGLATPTQINATPTSKTVENPGFIAWSVGLFIILWYFQKNLIYIKLAKSEKQTG